MIVLNKLIRVKQTLAATWYILPVVIIFVTSYCSKISKTVLPQKTQDIVGK